MTLEHAVIQRLADEIVMSDHVVLATVVPRRRQYPAVSLLKKVEQKSKGRLDDKSLILANQAKAITQVQTTILELVRGKHADSVADNLAAISAEGR